jgi:hypothetical protein
MTHRGSDAVTFSVAMPNWNRIIVGDAFKLPSRNPRFYTDLILMFPTLVAGIWFLSCLHGWRVYRWGTKEAFISGGVLFILLLLIKERTVLVAAMLGFLAYQCRLAFLFRGDVKALELSFLLSGGAFLTILLGVGFRTLVLKNPDIDPTYRKPDSRNTWLGTVLVLGILFGLGSLGIYLAWR